MITLDRLRELTGVEDEDKLTRVLSEIEENEHGLVRTKDQLLRQVKGLQEKVRQFDGVDVNAYHETLAELEELRARATTGGEKDKGSAEELKALEARLSKKFTDQLSAKEQELAKTRTRLHQTMIGTELRAALDQVGVADEHRDLIYNAYRGRAKAEESDGMVAVVIESDDGLALAPTEFFRSWAATDQGKRYIKAPSNSGGSATGGRVTRPDGPKEIKRSDFERRSHTERAQLMSEGYVISE